jgi:hypothetical protein
MSDKLAEVYAHLVSMQKNLPSTFEVDEKYVRDFNSLVGMVEQDTSRKLDSFLVPASALHRERMGGNYITGEVRYSDRNVCITTDLKLKIDALLGFFTIKRENKDIGFR